VIKIISFDDKNSTTRRVITLNEENNIGKIEGGLRTRGDFKVEAHDEGIPICAGKNGGESSSDPLITVITVVFNGAEFLEETIKSVINQSYNNVEFIIVDGGSTDGTLEILNKYNNKIDYWMSERDSGIYDAWNKAVLLASGVWISFLGADDVYKPEALVKYSQEIQKNSTINYISSRVELVNNGEIVRIVGGIFNPLILKKHLSIAHVGSLHKKDLFLKFGLFSLHYKIAADYEFFVRNSHNIKPGFLDESTVKMRIGGVSDSGVAVIKEVSKIKYFYKLRGKYSSFVDLYLSVIKWYLRKKLWY